jgi:hypothetical protein
MWETEIVWRGLKSSTLLRGGERGDHKRKEVARQRKIVLLSYGGGEDSKE